MIYSEMYAGLGNQMFNYAFARILQKKTGQEITFRTQQLESGHCNYNLDKFYITNVIVNKKNGYLGLREFYKSYGIDLLIKRVILKLFIKYAEKKYPNQEDKRKRYNFCIRWEPFLNRLGIFWGYDGYQPIEVHKNKNYYLCGSFMSPKYFDEYRELICHELKVKKEPDKKNKEAIDRINSCKESVCIHIRRGDYLSDTNKRIFDVCTPEYYRKAIEYCELNLHNPEYFVFSNDILWAKENIAINERVHFMDINSEQDAADELRLMYSCNNFIIANSTFSWWAQYLCDNVQKKVISPSRFFNIDIPCDLIGNDWICIDV